MHKQIITSFFIIVLLLVSFGCNKNEEDVLKQENETTEKDKPIIEDGEGKGKELRIGIAASPPSLDPHTSTALIMAEVTRTMYETLLTTNASNEIVPQLAESYEVSEDGKKYTFKLRKGILFHNGKEMKSEDVVASMTRWAELSTSVPDFLKNAEFSGPDEETVILELEEPSALTLSILSKDKYYGAILPKEVIESAGDTGITEHIGTGPFKFVEWKQDQFIHQTRFEDYQPIDLPSDGLSGKKEALVDDLYFINVPDSTTQIAGIRTGEYDVILGVPGEYYEQLNGEDSVNVHVSTEGHSVLFFNKNEGLFTDVRMRQAVNAAVDVEAVMLSGFGNSDLFEINSSYEHGFWDSDAGSEFYNEKNIEKAKKLLEEAGYDGEPITFVTTRDYENHYNQALVIQEELQKIGINVELEVYDWPTRNEKLEDPSNWDLSITGVTVKATPIEHIYLNQDYVNGPEDEKINDLILQMTKSKTLDDAKKIWDDLQGYLWEYLTVVKLGDTTDLSVTTNKVNGYQHVGGPVFWNVSKND